jgi:hypothetical protein
MRPVIAALVLIASVGCSFERVGLPPRPQKNALRMCASGQQCVSPLLLVDGVRTSWDEPGDFNPSDIATVEVAKGDSAVARFGEDARRGVVIITTRKTPRN